jgi:CRISPR-associated protein Cmr1
MGGGTATRKVDQLDYVRATSIRGHLRFWWRALHGGDFASAAELYAAESRLWGGVHGQAVIRSAVDVACAAQPPGEAPEHANVTPNDPHAYALWPAREEKKHGVVTTPAGERWRRLDWRLTIRVPESREQDVRRVLAAWILFGGYGGRTRRGCGSLDVVLGGAAAAQARAEWLPREASLVEIERVLGQGALAATPRGAGDLPLLAGSRLYTGDITSSADTAWAEALTWLRSFRQEAAPTPPDDDFAREPQHGPSAKQRPGPSRWPEGDKLRHLAGSGPWAHMPRHNDTPVWPRAGFGLPIITRFQQKDINGEPYRPSDPREQFELVWQRSGEDKPHDRLASPLILKPLALADGRFVAIALWLHRAYPAGGRVLAREGKTVLAGSEADFDLLSAPGDTPLYRPLRAGGAPPGERLKNAFFDWLTRTYPRVRRLA